MNKPTAAERLPVADIKPDDRSGRVTLSRVTGAAGLVILRLQLRWLRYTSIPLYTERSAAIAAVRQLIADAGWRITRQSSGGLEARTPGSMFDEGERISVEFRDHEVLVASICDPQVGFSLVGHQRCIQHCERVRRAVQNCA